MEEKFEEFYSNYSNSLDEYYEKFKKVKTKVALSTLGLCIVLILLVVMLSIQLDILGQNMIFLEIGLYLAIIISCIIGVIISLKRETRKICESIIKDMIIYISGNSDTEYEPTKRVSRENIKEMELFDLNNLEYNGRNFIKTNYNGNVMTFADMEIYYYKDKVTEERFVGKDGKEYIRKKVDKIKKYVFDGCYISATLNKKIAEHIYLIPNNFSDLIINGSIKDYITYSGKEIDLENLEFSQKYKVYSDDEIQARYILSLSLMEKINNIDDILKGKKYIVFKENQRFVICLEGFKIEELKSVSIPFSRKSNKLKESIKYIFKNIFKLFEIYNILDLGNDVYVDVKNSSNN